MTTELILRISIAAILGGIIGLERNYRAKEAGFRTHFLVALGSALFMVISQYGFTFEMTDGAKVSFDPSRIASQVVTGIGFIGAGTIIFQKHVVKGLTTAAGVWVTAAIGLASGAGMYVIATAATLFVLICLEILSVLVTRFGTRNISLTFTRHHRHGLKAQTRQHKNIQLQHKRATHTRRNTLQSGDGSKSKAQPIREKDGRLP